MTRTKRITVGTLGVAMVWSAVVVGAGAMAQSTSPKPKTNQFGVFDVPNDRRVVQALNDLGVGWVRLQLPLGERKPQMYVQVLKQGFALWLTVYHRDRTNVNEQGTVGFSKTKRGGFPPNDPARYQELVRRTIEPLVKELQAQGKRPGEWLVVQIGNEVLPRDVAPPDKPMRFWHGTTDQYLQMLSLAYEAVKSVDPNIPVALEGFASEMLDACIKGQGQAVTLNDRLLREGRFDWVDAHLYNRIEDIPAKVTWVRSRWDGPIAATEVGGPDPHSESTYTEASHAEHLTRRIRTTLEAGVARVFWIQLFENPHADERFMQMALITRGEGRRKPAFDAYRQLIAEMSR